MKKFLKFVMAYRIEKMILKDTPFILYWAKGNNKCILKIENPKDLLEETTIGQGKNYREYECLQIAMVWIDARMD